MDTTTCNLRRWILIAGVAFAAQSLAQNSSGTADSNDAAELKEVVVSATRIGTEDIQKTALSITALDTQSLSRVGLNGLEEITRDVPGIAVTEQGGGRNVIVMRGIVTNGLPQRDNIEDQTTVSVYLDDAPISLAGATPDLRVYDLERVEVIRGPQGTLFGAGAMAGNIRYITRKPSTRNVEGSFEASGDVLDGGGTGYDARGIYNQPLIDDMLGLRVSAYRGRDAGFIDDVGLGQKNANPLDTVQARAAVRLENVGPVTADASYLFGRVDSRGSNAVYADLGNKYDSVSRDDYLDKFHFLNGTATYLANGFNVVSSTSYINRRISDFTDESYGQAFASTFFGFEPPLFTNASNLSKNHISDFSQELRLSATQWKTVKVQVGAFFERQKRHYFQDYPAPGFYEALGDGSSGLTYGGFTPESVFSGTQSNTTRQFAVFGELTYSPIEQLDLTIGARRFWWRQSFNLFFAGIFGFDYDVGAPLQTGGKSTERGTNPRINATVHINEDVIAFAEAAKGFRYGGINQPLPTGPAGCGDALADDGLTGAPLTFGRDYLWTYSIGEKARLFDRRVNFNTTAFFTRWNDVQTVHPLEGCGYSFEQNAGDVTSEGVEVETQWQATTALTLGASASYTKAEAEGPIANLNAPDGARVPYFPRIIASVQAGYQWQIPIGKLMLQADYSHRSSSPNLFDKTSSIYRVVPSSDIANAAFTLEHENTEWTLYGQNITNRRIVTGIDGNVNFSQVTGAELQPGDKVFLARPRTIGLKFGVHF